MSVEKRTPADTPMHLTFSAAAKAHFMKYLDKNHFKGVRFSVKKTGCSGLSYQVDYVNEPMAEDIVTPLSKDHISCIDKKSYPFLNGLVVDYVKEGLNHKLVFTNPNQTGQCGCGESFTVD